MSEAPGTDLTERSVLSNNSVAPSGWRSALWPTLAYLAFWQIALRVRDERIGTVILSTLISLVLVVVLAASYGRAVRSVRAALALTLIAALAAVPLRLMIAAGKVTAPWSWFLSVAGLADLAFIALGSGFGILLSRLLRGANMVPPIAAILALVDIWTVTLGGPVHQIMESESAAAQRVAEAMTVKLPTTTAGAAPIAVVGFADFLFIAFFVGAMCRFAGEREGFGRTVWPLSVVLSLYMLLVLITGWRMPALVPMAVVVVATHWRRFQYSRSEAFALLYAAVLVAAILGVGMLMRG